MQGKGRVLTSIFITEYFNLFAKPAPTPFVLIIYVNDINYLLMTAYLEGELTFSFLDKVTFVVVKSSLYDLA
jgi:hypothetical protein